MKVIKICKLLLTCLLTQAKGLSVGIKAEKKDFLES